MLVTSPPTERATLQDRVYATLSDEIAQGTLAPGERLRVAHLAQKFGTSQAPVREALRRLTEEGLAVTVPYVGSVVREPTWEEIQEVYSLRAELEAYAIRRALSAPHPPSFVAVRRALRDLGRAVRTGDEFKLIEADLEFHRQLCALSNSRLTVEVWDTLLQRVRGARLSILRKHPDVAQFSTAVPSHEALLALIESGDAAGAEEAARQHISEALALFATWSEVAAC